jgi:hypothetical protein
LGGRSLSTDSKYLQALNEASYARHHFKSE